jgi:hypothetical protein
MFYSVQEMYFGEAGAEQQSLTLNGGVGWCNVIEILRSLNGLKMVQNDQNGPKWLVGGICGHPSIFDHRVRYLASETAAPHRAFLNTSLGVHKNHSMSTVLEIRSVGDFR